MAHVVDSGPKNVSDSEKKTEPSHDSSSGEMYDPKTKIFDAKAILWTFGKCLTALLPVYLAGYYRMSTSLVVFGMVVYAGWKHTRETKEARLKSAVELVNDEQEYISSKSFRSRRDLPSWVNFPDVEKVEWLNKVIQQAWPFIGQYLEKLLTETIAPSIRGSSSHLQTLSFTKVDFGGKPMRVVGVKAHTENEKGQILLDVYISYVGDVEINVEVKRYFCKAGVKGIQLHGMMRVILEPLMGDVPIVGAVTMFFIQRPKLTINWTGLTNLLDVPGLNAMSDTKIMDAIASFLVLPNRLTVPLVADLHVAQLRCPLPRGVVRIHLLEADGLASTDNYVKGVMAGMSDPYALLRVGPQTFKSRHLDNTLNPKWDEMYEVIVHEVPGQELEVEMFDKDPDHDDFLGRYHITAFLLYSVRVFCFAEIIALYASRTGLTGYSVPLVLKETWYRHFLIFLVPTWYRSTGSFDNTNVNACSIFSTCLFHLFQVKDNDRVQVLGSLSIPVSRLLSCQDLALDEWFNLENSGPGSRIHINTVLRVNSSDTQYALIIFSYYQCVPPSPVSRTSSVSVPEKEEVTEVPEVSSSDDLRPLHTSPDPSFGAEVRNVKMDGRLLIWLIKFNYFFCFIQILDSKMAALLAMGSGPVLRNKQTATTGQIKISLSFQKKLTVIIHACRSGDSLDTYVSLILLPDKSKATKRKTSVKKKNLNPEFNERFEFDMSVEDAQRRELSVCVKNASTSFMNRDKDLIGQVSLPGLTSAVQTQKNKTFSLSI
uniref:Extended synaptotagmin-like protein 1b n=1 Tax=Cyprinus carpio TaxID=7962 RepID=A0A8C1ZVF0_CYPCA